MGNIVKQIEIPNTNVQHVNDREYEIMIYITII